MKRIIIVVLALTVALAACSTTKSTDDTPATSSTTTSGTDTSTTTSLHEDKVPETVSLEEAIELFKKDPKSEVPGWKLEEDGKLYEADYYVGNIHTIFNDVPGYTFIQSSLDGLLSYSDKTITLYRFGNIIRQLKLVDGTVYCGTHRRFLVIREGNEVKLIDFTLTEVRTIATGVKFVISTDYDHNSDAYGCLLYLMEDGSLKCPVWEYDELLDPIYEGSIKGDYVGPKY